MLATWLNRDGNVSLITPPLWSTALVHTGPTKKEEQSYGIYFAPLIERRTPLVGYRAAVRSLGTTRHCLIKTASTMDPGLEKKQKNQIVHQENEQHCHV